MDMIIALEESGEAELQETQGTVSKKRQYDRAKAEDVRLKAMEKLGLTEFIYCVDLSTPFTLTFNFLCISSFKTLITIFSIYIFHAI